MVQMALNSCASCIPIGSFRPGICGARHCGPDGLTSVAGSYRCNRRKR